MGGGISIASSSDLVNFYLIALAFVSLFVCVLLLLLLLTVWLFLRKHTTDLFIHIHAGHFVVVVVVVIAFFILTHAPYSIWLAERMKAQSKLKEMIRIISRVTSIWSRVMR